MGSPLPEMATAISRNRSCSALTRSQRAAKSSRAWSTGIELRKNTRSSMSERTGLSTGERPTSRAAPASVDGDRVVLASSRTERRHRDQALVGESVELAVHLALRRRPRVGQEESNTFSNS